MKRKIFIIGAVLSAVICMAACSESVRTYSDAEYIMFADTMSVNVVLQDQESFKVPVVSTVACDYDRTIGVEIIDKGSSAIEGLNYRLKTNTLTIPAGELRADVEVLPVYDSFNDTDSLDFTLALVMPEAVKLDLYGDRTRVVMYKSCPFVLDAFTGWCMVTSSCLLELPGTDNTSVQRLIWTEKGEEENTVVLTN